MTPQIALDLSLDGIAVLSRAEGGLWRREGVVRLESDDVSEGLTHLRAVAAKRVGEGFTSILLIPDSQLLFTSLERDDRDPKVTIRSLLRGRTPYPVDDLVFDYVQTGDRLQVAVVARETLAEAEEFAAGFGFRPVAIVGNPTDAVYPGRPNFGQTALATEILGGEALELDVDGGFEILPDLAPDPQPVPDPPAPPKSDPTSAAAPEVKAPKTTQEKSHPDGPSDVAVPPIVTNPGDALPANPQVADTATSPGDADVAGEVRTATPPAATPLPPKENVRQDSGPVSEGSGAPQSEAGTPSRKTEERSLPTFSSRRKPGQPEMGGEPGRVMPRLSAPKGVASQAASIENGEPDAAGAIAPQTTALLEKNPGAPRAGEGTDARPPDASASDRKISLAGQGLRRSPVPEMPKAPGEDKSADRTEPAAAHRMSEPPRKPGLKLGLLLTLSLLAFLGLVALWSVWGDGSSAPEAATNGQTGQNIEISSSTPDLPSADTDLAALLPAPSAGGGVTASGVVSPPVPVPSETPATEASASVAPPAVPEVPEPREAFGPEPAPVKDLASQDLPPVTTAEPVQTSPETDSAESKALPLVAESTESEGQVAATQGGTVDPAGFTVFAGRPAVEPVPRAEVAADTDPAEIATDTDTAEVAAVEDGTGLPDLRGIRPTERPADLAPEPAAPLPAIAAGFTRAELTRTRPSERPAAITAAAEAAAAAEDAAIAAAEAARVAAAEERSAAVEAAAAAAVASLASQATASIQAPAASAGSGSGLALALSERPQTRPRSVERAAATIVTRRREQAAPAAAASAASRASTAEVDGEDAAPTAQSSTQTIRSAGGSVARAATQSNAIRLREINLIGVYGRPNARRALVRLGNGRYVKVQVGDQLDRGRVTAIGDTQLVYQRGGRNLALTLPST